MSDERTLANVEPQTEKPKAPIAVTSSGVDFRSLGEMYRFCEVVHKSKLAPQAFGSPEAIMVAVQCGLEIGLSPMQALNSIAVINGRPSLWGDGALALIVSRPDFEDIEETVNEAGTEAKCTIKRKGRSPVVRTFSMDDAKRAKLNDKSGPWTQYPKRMLQMRARGFAMRDAYPDALRGVGIREEQQDVPIKQASAREVEPAKLVFADAPPATEPEREQLALEAGQ